MKLKRQAVSFVYAPFWKRLLAFVIDFLILDIVVLFPFDQIFSGLANITSYQDIISNEALTGQLMYAFIAISAIIVLYFTLFEYYLRQSPGKMVFNIYVISDYKVLMFWQALARNLLYLPIIPFIFLWIVDPLFLIFKNQRLSEMFTMTRTVDASEFFRTMQNSQLGV